MQYDPALEQTDWTLVIVVGVVFLLAFIVPLFWGTLWGKRHKFTDAELSRPPQPPTMIFRQNGDIDMLM